MKKLNARELRKSDPTPSELTKIKRNPIYFVLDEIIDTYNTGSLFRLADAIAVEKMYLCGEMEYPPNSRIHKASVGTEKWVPWEKIGSTIEAIEMLKDKGIFTVAIEQSPQGISYSNLRTPLPVAVVIGNESKGIDQKVLDSVDLIVELPMWGVNKSFNTWGCAAVIAYKILENRPQ